jgi:hypothetical protein
VARSRGRCACSTSSCPVPDEIAPGIVCEAAGGHTEGSMNILVETAEGTACICGDVVYDIQTRSSIRSTRCSTTSRSRESAGSYHLGLIE